MGLYCPVIGEPRRLMPPAQAPRYARPIRQPEDLRSFYVVPAEKTRRGE